jgi:hypothetical protein
VNDDRNLVLIVMMVMVAVMTTMMVIGLSKSAYRD